MWVHGCCINCVIYWLLPIRDGTQKTQVRRIFADLILLIRNHQYYCKSFVLNSVNPPHQRHLRANPRMYRYELILKNNKSLAVDVISWFITALNLLGFLGMATWIDKRGFIGAGALVVAFLIGRILKKNSYTINFILLLIPVIPWLIMGIYAMAFSSLALAGLFYVANKPKIVQVNLEGILFPAFPNKKYEWQEVNNTLLKDGLLTIDLKNNKLIQQLVEDIPKKIDEKEFNDFCREQLNKVH